MILLQINININININIYRCYPALNKPYPKVRKGGVTVFGNGYFDGHVVSNDGENIHYWREPYMDVPVIDDRWSTERLSAHGL